MATLGNHWSVARHNGQWLQGNGKTLDAAFVQHREFSVAGVLYEVQKRNSGRELEVVRVAFERQGEVLVPVGVGM